MDTCFGKGRQDAQLLKGATVLECVKRAMWFSKSSAGLVVALCCFLTAFACAKSSPIECSGVTRIEVRLPGKFPIPRDDNLLKTITKDDVIKNVCTLANQHLSKRGWRPEWDGISMAPMHFLKMNFFADSEYRGSFGIDRGFVSTSQEGYSIRNITPEELKQLLDALDITVEEFEALKKRRTEPRPWKSTQ